MKETLGAYFAGLEDPRSRRNQRHPLVTLMGTSLLAALSGIDSFSGIQDYPSSKMKCNSVEWHRPVILSRIKERLLY